MHNQEISTTAFAALKEAAAAFLHAPSEDTEADLMALFIDKGDDLLACLGIVRASSGLAMTEHSPEMIRYPLAFVNEGSPEELEVVCMMMQSVTTEPGYARLTERLNDTDLEDLIQRVAEALRGVSNYRYKQPHYIQMLGLTILVFYIGLMIGVECDDIERRIVEAGVNGFMRRKLG